MKKPRISKYDQVIIPANAYRYEDIDCRVDGKVITKDKTSIIRAYFEKDNPIPIAYGLLNENLKVTSIIHER